MPHLPATGGRDVHTVRFPVGRPPATVDVLIVGAGPVGLAAATELTARGIRVAVVDRARTATLVRAGAMGHTPRVVEHFRRWGLLQRIREAWTYPRSGTGAPAWSPRSPATNSSPCPARRSVVPAPPNTRRTRHCAAPRPSSSRSSSTTWPNTASASPEGGSSRS
ncbi:FAD-dependent oxidoreductase [Streptomyces cavourensis]